MIVILAILAATRAFPVGQTSPPLVSIDQLQPRSCNDPQGGRSLWDIIWSCAVTLFLCTWVSIHPNIPSPEETWLRIAIRRVGLMVAALFVPEAMIGWAMRQRLAAAELAENHKEEGWTITHGFFAIMGGFMEYEGNRPIRVLLPEQLKSYSLTGNGGFPRIAKEEIEDKSKGDFISKALVVLQTGWFVTQCIARAVQGLSITELELVTVAFAGLNFVMYLLWWDKPLNVQRGVRVYKKRNTEQPLDDGNIEANSVGFWGAIGHGFCSLPTAIVRGPFAGDDIPWIVRVVAWPFMKPFVIFWGELKECENSKRINTFYPCKQFIQPGTGTYRGMLFTGFIVTSAGLAFGGIHCIGWSFAFPSGVERKFWRVTSVSITAIPMVLMLELGLFLTPPPSPDNRAFNWAFNAGFMVHILLILLYIFGRFALLVLPFLCLRSLPPAAYHVVHWTSFIPHL
ncbi:hypothetical protein F5148DRAFT_979998 [Russula earlei]|uniref:Uncharacterized protein n=1 Tax=Russula earlei TaxID=71964 RepID=A0ACC0UB22_9AGAM|nr:hypothetical protein F5148DRAFT_979998 [Russula earlei]